MPPRRAVPTAAPSAVPSAGARPAAAATAKRETRIVFEGIRERVTFLPTGLDVSRVRVAPDGKSWCWSRPRPLRRTSTASRSTTRPRTTRSRTSSPARPAARARSRSRPTARPCSISTPGSAYTVALDGEKPPHALALARRARRRLRARQAAAVPPGLVAARPLVRRPEVPRRRLGGGAPHLRAARARRAHARGVPARDLADAGRAQLLAPWHRAPRPRRARRPYTRRAHRRALGRGRVRAHAAACGWPRSCRSARSRWPAGSRPATSCSRSTARRSTAAPISTRCSPTASASAPSCASRTPPCRCCRSTARARRTCSTAAGSASRRAYVERVSGGRLGYVHLYDMGPESLTQFYQDLDVQNRGRAGVVIDIRNNNGGFVDPYALDVLTRREYLRFASRFGFDPPERTSLGPARARPADGAGHQRAHPLRRREHGRRATAGWARARSSACRPRAGSSSPARPRWPTARPCACPRPAC